MRSQRFEDPRLFIAKADELPLSGRTLLELMRAVLEKGVPFRFRARGWSMAPFIHDGDIVTVSPLQGRPGFGEVVAFVHPVAGMLVVHRVIARNGNALFIQGDSITARPDGMVPLENLLGRVICVERDGHPVRIGLGPERWVIAWLSRVKLLIPIREWLVSLLKSIS